MPAKTLKQIAQDAAKAHEILARRVTVRRKKPGVQALRGRTYAALHTRMRAELKVKA